MYGHYLAIGNGSARRGTYYKTVSASSPNLLTSPGIRGVQVRYKWVDLEPTAGTYNFGTVKATYPDTEMTIRADLWRCAQNNSRLIVMIEDKSFDGLHTVPLDLQYNTTTGANGQFEQPITTGQGSAYCAVRWNPTIISRFGQLLTALGAAFDTNPNWYAFASQETATDFTAQQRTDTGYTDVAYRDALISMLQTASLAFPRSQIFWYTNFFPSTSTDFRLQEVADTMKTFNNGDSGVVMGGPDILPDNTSIATRVEPRFGVPPTGSYGELDLFNSMQNDSYSHVHTTSTPDPRLPGATWTLGSTWTMDHLFRHGRDNLNLNYVIWNYWNAGTRNYDPDGLAVIAANQTWTP
jgi:hypothetical protein